MIRLTDGLEKRIVGEILKAPRAFLFLDYDGTLASLKPRPELAVMSVSMKKILSRLSSTSRCSVGIITGRKLKTIQSLVKMNRIVYAGNHGFEMAGPGFRYRHPRADGSARMMKKIAAGLRSLPRHFPGTFLENKGITMTYHYRLLDDGLVPSLISEFHRRLSPWVRSKKARISESKKALEVRPNVSWDKGNAVKWILRRQTPRPLPVFIGDDKTDESAFKALKGTGITIRVGKSPGSYARYYLKDEHAVEKLLSLIAGGLNGTSRS